MIGNKLVTKGDINGFYSYTGEQGFLCRNVYIMEELKISSQFFVQIVLSRNKGCPEIIYSKHGGLNYETILKNFPDDIHSIYVDYSKGLEMSQLLMAASHLEIEQQKSQLTFILKHLYDLFIERDLDRVEINPFVLTADHDLCVATAQMKINHDSVYRQQEMELAQDFSQMHYKERIALNSRLNYIHLEDGNIGLISNGAGMCMATMDLITLHGGAPANFCDLGGQAHHEKITASLVQLEKDNDVKIIYINVFCGQLSADKMALVIREANDKHYVSKPIVIRIRGQGSDEAKQILSELEGIFINDCYEDSVHQAIKIAEIEAEKEEFSDEQDQKKKIYGINPTA